MNENKVEETDLQIQLLPEQTPPPPWNWPDRHKEETMEHHEDMKSPRLPVQIYTRTLTRRHSMMEKTFQVKKIKIWSFDSMT